MAHLDVKFHENRFEIISQAFCCDIHDTWENRKVWFVVLRALWAPETGKPLFSYQTLADAFGYPARQNIHNVVREYARCNENVFDDLRHRCKVGPLVVEAVREELRRNVLMKPGELRIRVNQRLQRDDFTSANVRAALEQIPCTVIRDTVLRGIAPGAFHPKEEYVLAELFSMLESRDAMETGVARRGCFPVEAAIKSQEQEQRPAKDGEREVGHAHAAADSEKGATLSEAEEERGCVSSERSGHAATCIRNGERVAMAGIQAIREDPDEAVIQKIQADCVQPLLTPHVPMSDIPESVGDMVTSAAMYYSNVSLSRIGRWFGGKAKSTIYNWVMG